MQAAVDVKSTPASVTAPIAHVEGTTASDLIGTAASETVLVALVLSSLLYSSIIYKMNGFFYVLL